MSSQFQINSTYKPKSFNKVAISEPPQERFAFNFSFLTPDKQYNLKGNQVEKKTRLKLLDKIYSLSQKDMIDLLSHDDKYNGLEKIPESEIKKLRIHPIFRKTRYKACDDDFWVFQLSKQGRVIGKKYKNIFYIMSIDTKFNQYNHGS
ncbi:hypothetical protein [uncultured Lactobacillus sp.]|uniref:hypothetical protein n=1 Tax=uncultured Lactobacillus sp. TaxID=153152 RepID=UPI00261A0505|nr:hypothetical protein [uncultured Lactobacillus sp.]